MLETAFDSRTVVAAAHNARPGTIALIGAECTGKTTLARALAAELPGIWLPEALREFCDREGRTPRPVEQATLMHEQIEREARACAQAAREGVTWVICDSTALVTALYSVLLFSDYSLLGAAIAHQRQHTVTLLTDTDLPWASDGIQRDGPAVRDAFHRLLVATLRDQDLAHAVVSGNHVARLDAALSAVRAGL